MIGAGSLPEQPLKPNGHEDRRALVDAFLADVAGMTLQVAMQHTRAVPDLVGR